jgi:biopolymer transport protein ExbD
MPNVPPPKQGPPVEEAPPRKRKPIAKEPEKPEEPPLTPFIDIIFQILIFFMLSMKFKQQEGHLLSMLPKDKGLFSTPVDTPELNEVRIYVCADMNRRMDQHIGYKEKHQDFIKDQKGAGQPVGDICYTQIELNFKDQDQLFRTEKFPGKYGHNRAIYNKLCDQVKVMLDSVRSKRDPNKAAPTILDIDGNTPFEHAIGLLNGLTKRRISDIEWAGNPRFDRYFGPAGQ